MRLQRIAVYRATRILSWVLPVVILVFVGIAAWSYWSHTQETPQSATTSEELPPEVAVQTTDVEYVVSVSGRDQFQVRAKKMQVSRDNRSMLTGVEVLIYAQKAGDPDRRIRGDTCSHDKRTEQVHCSHNVSVELEPGTIARTEQLSYEPKMSVISSSVQTALDRVGEMTGHAGKMDYFVNTGLMRLMDGFSIDLTQGGGMRGGIGVFQYKEHWATVSNSVELTSTNGRIHGGSGRAELSPGTYRAKKIMVEGGAGAEAPSFAVSSDWLEADLADSGSIDHVLGRGSVHAEYKSAKQGSTPAAEVDPLLGTLNGPEVEAWLQGGRLGAVEARQHPDFTGSSGVLRAAEKIRIEPAGSKSGSVRTEGQSSFSSDNNLKIDGRNFVIRVNGDAQVFNTSSRATLKSGGLIATADRTEAHLDTKTNMLTSMVQTGNVSFEEDQSERHGSADKLTVRNGGDLVEFEGGKPSFTDDQGTIKARKITFNRKTGSFIADGNVQMLNAGTGGKPLVVTADHAEGGETQIEYKGNVQMFPGDAKIDADHVKAYPKESRFEADGHVHSLAAELEVWSRTLDIKDSGRNQQTAHYTGDVRAEKRDKEGILSLRTEDLNVHLKNADKGGQADSLIATGGVEVTQGARTGRGDRMEYNVTTREMLLVGTAASEAEVNDRGRNEFVKACRILVMADGSKAAANCSGRSVTSSIKVQK